MRIADVDPFAIHALGAVIGIALGLAAARAVDALPRRYGITASPSRTEAPHHKGRDRIVLAATAAGAVGIAHVVAGAPELDIAHAALLFLVNAVLTAAVVAAAAIDREHMILPDEITLGGAALALMSSPLRFVGLGGSLVGLLVGLASMYLPLFL
jgi:leader peptidase (prepilin peptidase)/N-methyltransferase